MKLIKQFLLILLFSFLGELCHSFLPLPIPASIYGMVFMLVALLLKIVKIDQLQETGAFLVKMLPLLFVVPTVGLVLHWEVIRPNLLKIAIILVVTTVLTFAVSGLLTKLFRKGRDAHD